MIDWLLSPLALLLLAGVLLAWCCYRKRPRWACIASGALSAVALAAMTPFGSNVLLAPLERPIAVPAHCRDEMPSIAVVLGGGLEGWPDGSNAFSVLNLASRQRMDRAVAWWREGDGRTLVLVGGPPHPGIAPIAGLMAAYATMQGMPSTALRVEIDSDDTWSNARHAARMQPALPRRIVLLTSSVHMRRAMDAFTVAGFQPCPLGAGRLRLPSRLPWALVPRTRGLANSETALHEWAGLLYYRWLAWQQGPAADRR